MTNILIAGIGGVGGYFGGLLAKEFQHSETVAINFLARGAHLKAIQEKGLTVLKGDTEIVAYPALATDQVTELSAMDYIVVCTKSYDLEDVIQQLLPCIKNNTIILPLLNGVDSRERIKMMLPDITVCDGCAYIVSRITKPGEVVNSGNMETLYFGLNNIEDERLSHLAALFSQAGIKATCSKNILTTIWEKFIFLAPIATATSCYNQSIGELLANKEHKQAIEEMVTEVMQLARLRSIPLTDDIATQTMHKIQSLPFDTTTSMHNDFKSGKAKTEIESLTGYVVRVAQKMSVELPVFERLYNAIIMKIR
jgi:2-dehydropantoate 2-reductase